MDEEFVKGIKEELERSHWGWRVYYWPEYKDFIVCRRIVEIFMGIIPYYKNVQVGKIDKDKMDWAVNIRKFTRLFFGKEWDDAIEIYTYVNEDHKIILFR